MRMKILKKISVKPIRMSFHTVVAHCSTMIARRMMRKLMQFKKLVLSIQMKKRGKKKLEISSEKTNNSTII